MSVIASCRQEAFVSGMNQQMERMTRRLVAWVCEEPRTLGEIEAQVWEAMHRLGNVLLGGLVALCVPAYPEPSVPCSCGEQAVYQRSRAVQVLTLLGLVVVRRPYYLCFSCHHGTAPLDQQLGICAGGISVGLANALALVGVQLPFNVQISTV